MRVPALLLLLATPAASEPDPELQTPLLAALAVPKAVPGKRCINRKISPLSSEAVAEALDSFSLDWSRDDLRRMRASLTGASYAGERIDSRQARMLKRYGWSVVDTPVDWKRTGCRIFVSVSGPVLAGKHGLAQVTYRPMPDDRGAHIVPVLMEKGDYGWSVFAVGSGFILVI